MAKAFTHVINTHFPIFVEVEPQPVFAYKHIHIAVCASNILEEGGLFVSKNMQKHANEVGHFINKEHNALINFSIGLLQLSWNLKATVFHLVKFSDVVDVWVGQFICVWSLNVVNATCALKKPQVN